MTINSEHELLDTLEFMRQNISSIEGIIIAKSSSRTLLVTDIANNTIYFCEEIIKYVNKSSNKSMNT
jgi:hypothetical protein